MMPVIVYACWSLTQFMLDSELNWQDGMTPVDDL